MAYAHQGLAPELLPGLRAAPLPQDQQPTVVSQQTDNGPVLAPSQQDAPSQSNGGFLDDLTSLFSGTAGDTPKRKPNWVPRDK